MSELLESVKSLLQHGRESEARALLLDRMGRDPRDFEPVVLLVGIMTNGGQWQAAVTATWLQWAMLGFVAVVGYYFAYTAWFTLLRQCRLDEASPFLLLMPVVGIVTAALVLGESVSVAQLIGGAVILFGLAIVSGIGLPKWKTA